MPNKISASIDYISIGLNVVLTGFVSLLMSWVVASWKVRKQHRLNEISGLEKLIESVTSSASSYWLSSGRNKNVEQDLKHKLYRVSAKITELFPKDEELKHHNITFRRQITGGQFENENRPVEDGRVSNIVDISEELLEAIKNKK